MPSPVRVTYTRPTLMSRSSSVCTVAAASLNANTGVSWLPMDSDQVPVMPARSADVVTTARSYTLATASRPTSRLLSVTRRSTGPSVVRNVTSHS